MSYDQAVTQSSQAPDDAEAKKRLSELNSTGENKCLKQSTKWGPTHDTRQSASINGDGHTIME
jgi:hypothetical protein